MHEVGPEDLECVLGVVDEQDVDAVKIRRRGRGHRRSLARGSYFRGIRTSTDRPCADKTETLCTGPGHRPCSPHRPMATEFETCAGCGVALKRTESAMFRNRRQYHVECWLNARGARDGEKFSVSTAPLEACSNPADGEALGVLPVRASD